MLTVCLLFGVAIYAQDSVGHKSIHQMQHEQYKNTTTPQEKVTVMPGIENLFANYIYELQGKNVAVVVNHTAVDKNGVHLIDRLVDAGIQVKAIFGPEHGYRGESADGQQIQDGVDPVSGAHVYSLYGKNRKPTDEMLQGVDAILYDIQDVGVRFYTYISTMGYAMQAAAEHDIPFWVLDRPDPITGVKVEGPMLQEGHESFVGLYPIPVRYGMTPGELAKMIVGEQWMEFPDGFEPRVIKLTGWQRPYWYDNTDIPWVAPSPNMSTLATATVYPGLCFIEGTNISEGRGTPHPFLWIGAPWIDGKKLSQALNDYQLKGVVFEPIQFTPEDIPGVSVHSKYRGEKCEGIKINVTNRDAFAAVPAGVYIIATVKNMYPNDFKWRRSAIDRLYGSDHLRTSLDEKMSPKEIVGSWDKSLEQFKSKRAKYLIY